MIHKATISLNMIRKSILQPHLSVYAKLYREFDYSCTPLYSPGTKVVIHNIPGDRAYWEPHCEPSQYIGSAMEHYRCHKTYIPKTRAERVLDTVEFFLPKYSMQNMSSTDADIHAAHDLTNALKMLHL